MRFGTRTLVFVVISAFLVRAIAYQVDWKLLGEPLEPHNANAMWIDPSNITYTSATLWSTFNVTVWLNITSTSVFCYQIALRYNGTQLNCTRAGYTSGITSQLFRGHTTSASSPFIDYANNGVLVTETLLAPDNLSAPCSGSLLWVEFVIVALPSPGEILTSKIDISSEYPANTWVLDPNLDKIPVTTYDGLYTLIPETHLAVPFHYQEKDYYCGPACLEMVFDYYGEDISQSEIACVARSIGDPLYVTYTDELRRAGHFSNISTSMGDEIPNNITGYSLRQLGYAAFEAQGMDLQRLRDFLDQGKPLILLMYYSSYHVATHYRVATGYNETHVFLHDPWNQPLWGGAYGGPDIAFNNTQFLDLWSYWNSWTLYVSPWTVNFSAPAYVELGTPFQIESSITYPQPLPGALSTYPAHSCTVSITLPAGLSLAGGESQEKTVGTGFLYAGDSYSINWTVVADSPIIGTISITVEGMISGSVPAHSNYGAYSYTDRIGGTVKGAVGIAVRASSSTNILGGTALVNQTAMTGVSVSISGSSAPDGTVLNITSIEYGTTPPPITGMSQVNGTIFYDVQVNSSVPLGSGATVAVYITNSDFIGHYYNVVMSYWDGNNWVPVASQFIASDTLCGSFSVACLTGTPIMVQIVQTTSGGVGGGMPYMNA